ncbi:hypothetical protein M5K25_016690 [Dendrobium thyrsiflorum]|uniref:Uncharacterized protein n=1 Tax=Dendrobium thyrsiflorum TaxID=117978 RepID=A0ABD0UKW7_DENTH
MPGPPAVASTNRCVCQPYSHLPVHRVSLGVPQSRIRLSVRQPDNDQRSLTRYLSTLLQPNREQPQSSTLIEQQKAKPCCSVTLILHRERFKAHKQETLIQWGWSCRERDRPCHPDLQTMTRDDHHHASDLLKPAGELCQGGSSQMLWHGTGWSEVKIKLHQVIEKIQHGNIALRLPRTTGSSVTSLNDIAAEIEITAIFSHPILLQQQERRSELAGIQSRVLRVTCVTNTGLLNHLEEENEEDMGSNSWVLPIRYL